MSVFPPIKSALVEQCPRGCLRLFPTEIRKVNDAGARAAGGPGAEGSADGFTSFSAHSFAYSFLLLLLLKNDGRVQTLIDGRVLGE